MPKGAVVKVRIDENFDLERALRRFKRLCESYGVVREYRRRQEYRPPSACRKEKEESAAKRRRKLLAKNKRTSRI